MGSLPLTSGVKTHGRLAVRRGDLLNELRLVERAAVAQGGDEAGNLQGCHQRLTLTDRQVGGV